MFILFDYKFLRRLLSIVFCFLILYVILFRYGIGTDYFSYKVIFNSMSKTNFTLTSQDYSGIELGYILLSIVAKNMGVEYELFVAIIGVFLTLSYLLWSGSFIKGRDFTLVTLIFISMFFLVWVLSAYRQGIVIAVLLLTVFSYRSKLRYSTKILIIILLSYFHYSSLVVLLYLFLEKLLVDKKRMYIYVFCCFIIFLVGTLIIPYLTMLSDQFSYKYLNKFFVYMRDDTLSISALVIRLCFLSYFLYLFDWFSKGEAKVFYLYKIFMIGSGMYLALSNSALIASRSTIYSYIMLPVLLVLSTGCFDKYIKLGTIKIHQKTLVKFGLVFFSAFFMVKETGAFVSQSEYTSDILFSNIPTVFNKDPSVFKSSYAFNDYISILNSKLDLYIHNNDDLYGYQESDKFVSYFDEKAQRYGILNQEGKVAVNPVLFFEPKIYGFIYENFNVEGNRSNYIYASINPDFNESKVDYVNDIKKLETNLRIQYVYEYETPDENTEIHKSISRYLSHHGIDNFTVENFKVYNLPFHYSIARIEVYDDNYYLLLDGNYAVQSENLYSSSELYDINGFIKMSVQGETHIYNPSFELIFITK